jgi:threonine-phosphate decarboxylase
LVINKGRPVHGGNVWAASKKWGIDPGNFLDYSANINPLGPSLKAVQAIKDNLGSLEHYPEPTGEALSEVLSKFLGVSTENLVLGNGGAELIYLVGRMFYKKRIMLLAPTFSEYGEGIEGAIYIRINLKADEGFKLPTSAIIAEVQEDDLIFIGNPNNPTGNIFPRGELLKVIKIAEEKKAVVIIDEAFIDFLDDDHFYSVRHDVEKYKNLIVVGSLTKFFALPSLRLGYAVAAKDTAKRMETLLPTWRINTFALKAGEASLKDVEYIKKTRSFIKRDFLTQELVKIDGLKVYPSVANFILIDAQEVGITSKELQEKLGPKGILIRKCDSYYNLSPYYFRIAVRKREENIRLLNALKKVVDKS